ncbi:Gfo/Idh/MocA family oxidoreductase [Paenibacillus sp. JX-17]|uniref:Gfo/Idh/MocA family oxidoreductase n=1 Tax=Paenibacillus lacisoli TaxID=3064525 RepID=A0ABT9CHD3_9BACL|nr:Gfo/Idh/MocA family oxidoreductase [Paenibacillus sp. JX-17]MDO7907988.1 Gfo/Idh/MocA family oxidoreductase [Paenibacillus sp. JX-17]
MFYTPTTSYETGPVCGHGEFPIAAVCLDHGHIYGMCNGLVSAGANVKWVYDTDPQRIKAFQEKFPKAQAAPSLEAVLEDESIRLVAAAAIPNERGPLGIRVMLAGKDYFTDKAPFTSLAQLKEAEHTAAQTGCKYMVYYSERLHVESAVYAGQLIEQGAIGRVVQVMGTGPHRLNAKNRPEWFFRRAQYGGILCDIGSHQIEQFLTFSSSEDAVLNFSRVGNFSHPEYPELEDFGEVSLTGSSGASGYMRVDWFTPDGLGTWGDGRTLILGTDGYIELRKYIDVGRETRGNQVYLVNHEGEYHFNTSGKVGHPFFGLLIQDVLQRTEVAMTQSHAFKAAELCLIAQQEAWNRPNALTGFVGHLTTN